MILLHAASILFGNVLLAALGAGLLMLIDAWRRLGGWTRPAVALLAGQAGFVTGAPLLLYAGLSLSPIIVLPPIALLLAAGLAVERRRGQAFTPRNGGGGWTAALALTVPLLVLAGRALLHPLYQFDAMSNWVMKAAVLWAGGHRLTGVLDARLFARPDLHPQSHLEYPVGLNALLAWGFHWMGAVDIRVMHLQFVLMLAAAAGTAWALARPIVPPLPLTVGLVGFVLMPALVNQLLTAYADVPLACIWAAGALALIRWGAEDERYLLGLATLLLAGALAMKQDGAFYDVAIYVAVGAPLVARERGRLLQLGVSAGIVVLTTMPWRVYAALHDLTSTNIRPGLTRMQGQTGNLPPTIEAIGHALTNRTTFVAVPIAVVFALASVLRRRYTEAIPFLIATGLVLVSILSIYWNAAVNLRSTLIPALPRILISLVALAWLLLPSLVHSALARREMQDGRSVFDVPAPATFVGEPQG